MAERAYTYGEISYYNRYMTQGNLAYDNEPAVEKEKQNSVRKHKKVSILENPKKLFLIAISLIIAGFFVIIWRSAIISTMNTQVVEMKNTLNVYHSQNEQTAVLLDKTTDLEYVEDVAKNKLNMDVPKTEQKIYIDVDVADMVEIPTQQKNGFFSGIKTFINNCLEYLY